MAKWPFKFAQECARTAFSRRARVILPHVLRRAYGRCDLWKRPLRPQLCLCLRQSQHCAAAVRSSRSGGRPDLRLCAGQAGTLQQHSGRAAPPLYPRYETAFRGRQLSLTSRASAQLPAVRPTAAQSRAHDRGLARKKEAGQTTLRLRSGRLPEKSLKRGYRHF